jgi:hypothetical protein
MENVFISSKFFLIFAKLLGFFPMSVNQSSMKVKNIDIFMTCCSYTALIAINIETFWHDKFFTLGNTFIQNAWDVIKKTEMISYIFLFAYQLRARKKIFSFFKDVHRFDEKVRKFS